LSFSLNLTGLVVRELKKKALIGLLLLIVISSGCIGESQQMYVCPSGDKVSNKDLCPTENCVKEGDSIPVIPNAPYCCEGLTHILPKEEFIVGISGICTAKCGNGICDELTESSYNCAQDCKLSEECIIEGHIRPDYPNSPPCCEGLDLIKPKEGTHFGQIGICTAKCGNGICESKSESSINCPVDCKPPDTTTSTSTSTTTPSPTHEPLKQGDIVVFFQTSLGSGTSYQTVEGQTLVMKSSAGGVFRYLSEENPLALVKDYVSPSYAKTVIHPYTVDGRLILVQIWPDSKRARFKEFDPFTGRLKQDNSHLGEFQTNSPYTGWSDYAIVGDRVYFKTKFETMVFGYPGGIKGGDLMVGYSSNTDRELLNHDDPHNFGSLHSTGDGLYRVKINEELHYLQINRIDLETGKIARWLQFPIDDFDDFTSWVFSVDHDAFYVASLEKNARVVKLWRLSWAEFEEGNVFDLWKSGLVYSQTLEDKSDGLLGLDADSGYVVLELFTWGKGSFILYDHNTDSATTYYPGHDPRSVQILKLR
jgi:hypothetical protein